MGVELELKYRASEASLLAIEAAFPQPGSTIAMKTVYYDTPDGALSARRYTLRKRLENGVSICTLKTPAQQGRNEWEVQCDSIAAAIPELCKLGGPEELLALTAQGVAPICGARFTRVAKVITLPDATIELALDRGVLTGGGKEIPLCEAEAELKSGSQEALVAFGKKLAARFSLKAEARSKFRRALSLAKGD